MTSSLALALLATALAATATVLALLWRRERGRSAHLRARLVEAEERATAAAAARNAFLNLVSHELRSPIAAIIGYQELLRDGAYGDLGDGAREPIERVGRSAYHLLHLIDGVVDLASQRSGSLSPHLDTVRLDQVVARASHAFRIHARERSLRHSVDVDSDLPHIQSDVERLERAIELMLVSALKYPAGDEVRLDARREPDGVRIQLRGTRIPIRAHEDDPVLRLGIRLAIVTGTAQLLGCDFHLEPEAGDTARRLILRVRPVHAALDPAEPVDGTDTADTAGSADTADTAPPPTLPG